jgi:DtxR family Mn-dependent transcriptional regulator
MVFLDTKKQTRPTIGVENIQMSLIPLTLLQKDHNGIIVSINAGMRATRRLTSLGLIPGTKISKISSAPFQGPVQLKVRETRLVVGRGLAEKILVRDIS